MDKAEQSHCCQRSQGVKLTPEEDLVRVKKIIVKLDASIRELIQEKTQGAVVSHDEILLINFAHLSGRCGDKVIGANIKVGAIYFHVYILDESSEPEVVKIHGPKDASVPVTGFS